MGRGGLSWGIIFCLLGIGESIFGKNMVNPEEIGTKGSSTVFISVRVAEQHSKNRGNSNVQKYIFLFQI